MLVLIQTVRLQLSVPMSKFAKISLKIMINMLILKLKPLNLLKRLSKKKRLMAIWYLKRKKKQVRAIYHGVSPIDYELKTKVKSYLQVLQSQLNLQQAQLAPHQLKVLQQQPKYREVIQKNHQGDKLVKMLSLIIVIMVVYMILISYSGITAQEIASEKDTKIMEIIFSSTNATKYFLDKILGIFGVIVTQLIIYIVGAGLFTIGLCMQKLRLLLCMTIK